jgi:hypothetical protein
MTDATNKPLAVGLEREAVARGAARRVLSVNFDFLAPDMEPSEQREFEDSITNAILALAAPAEGYVLVPVEAVQPFIDVLVDIGESEADEDTFRNANRYTAKAPAITVGHIRRLAACLPAAPTGETGA